MDRIKKPGSNPARQDAFIERLRAGHTVTAACRQIKVHPTQFYNQRPRDPEFAARWDAAKSEKVQYRKPESPFTNDMRDAFLAAMVEHGSAAAAARATGVVLATAYAARNRDMDFAAAWAVARRQIAEQIDDRMLEGALHGYEETVEVDGQVVRRTRRANPRMMLKIVERIEADRRSNGGKWIEITEESVLAARRTMLRRLVDGGSLTTMKDALDFAAGRRTPEETFFPDGFPPPKPAEPEAEPEIEPEIEPGIETAAPGRSLWD